jgi:hypothetical protein
MEDIELIEALERGAGTYALKMRGGFDPNLTYSWDRGNEVQWEAAQRLRQLGADALEAALPKTVSTEAEMDALSVGSVIRDRYGDVLELRGSLWCGYESRPMPTNYVARKYLPATLLHTPTETEGN